MTDIAIAPAVSTAPATANPELPHAAVVVDATGLLCPMPIVKLAEAIKGAEVGQVIEVTATDPGMLEDAPAWARLTRHEIVGQYSKGDRHSFWFRKLHA
jgi:tRNA 2-thiouridine synthesizing protein A